MSRATFTFGRFNPPTEAGHGKLVSAVQGHAEKSGGAHYIFPSHTQDSKKNPLSHGEKAGALRKLFPDANVVSNGKVKTAIDAMKHLESKGHTHVTMIVGSDRVKEFHTLLNKYRTKEFPGIKKVEVKSAGQRDPDAEGAEGMSASKLRGLVKAGKRDEFVSHYSNKELGALIHDKVKKAMSEETNSPIGIFLLGGPGSGKDYVLKNIFSRFDLTEVQLDQVLTGKASELLESKTNIVINGAADADKIELVKTMLEGYEFDTVYVSVTNKVSRVRNEERTDPLPENKRLEKWYRSEKLAEQLDCFVFNNSINLSESNTFEQVVFAGQIEKLLERLVNLGLVMEGDKIPHVARSGNITAVMNKRKLNQIRKPVSEEVWDEPNPKKKSKALTPAQKTKAKARAAKAGRKYPNLIDNMWAANESVNINDIFEQEINNVVAMDHEIISTETEQICCGGDGIGEAVGDNPQQVVDTTPTLAAANKKKKSQITPPTARDAAQDGLPVVTTGAYVREAKKLSFMPTPRQVPAPPGGHPVPPGYERVKSWGGAYELRKIREKPTTVKEAVEYHMENKISFTENVFRPGSEMFFEMIAEAKNLYKEGKYTPADKFEIDLLESDIGEIAEFEGQQVVLDYPIEEGLEECWTGYVQKGLKKKGDRMVPNCVPVNEEDKTDGKGIGKPWREGGGGAVYVRTGDGGVKKVRFSQSGMTKKFNDPGATKSFVARHHCLTNKDKTSASYWACRYPRFFSNSGKIWW